jgi:hypothetical protein
MVTDNNEIMADFWRSVLPAPAKSPASVQGATR